MKRTSIFVLFFFFLLFGNTTGFAFTEYGFDANTVLLDHFNGSSLAKYTGGSPTYVSSAPGLNQAINFTSGTFVKYDLPSWNSPSGGTLETWVNPSEYSQSLATLQWFNTISPPQDGFVGSLYIANTGKLEWGAWASGGLTSNSIIPLNQWSHVAITWGSTGSNFYLNGQLDAHTNVDVWPHMNNPLYVYLNNWGQDGHFVMDELRISNVARTQFSTVPLPPSVWLVGSGLLGLVGLRRFRKV